MKLRLLKTRKGVKLLCPNGSVMDVNEDVLTSLLTSFRNPNSFKGEAGTWSHLAPTMDEIKGETLAYVDERPALIIFNDEIFLNIVRQKEYISVSEYAAKHDKCRATIKNLCVAGRLPGAYKTSSGWLIPSDTPYPDRKPRTIQGK